MHKLSGKLSPAAGALSLSLLIAPAGNADDIAGYLDCTGCVSSVQIGTGAVTARELRRGSVTGSTVKNGSLTGRDIRQGSISGADIRDGSIRGRDVRDNSLTRDDIRDEPRIAYQNGGGTLRLDSQWKRIKRMRVQHPASGYINCISTGTLTWLSTGRAHAQIGWTRLTSTRPLTAIIYASQLSTSSPKAQFPYTAMHTFSVAGPGSTDFVLMGSATGSAEGYHAMHALSSIACMYFSTRG